LKVAPAKAMKFLLYENVRRAVAQDPHRATFFENFASSSLVAAGVTLSVHPVDTIKTRMSLAQGAIPPTLRNTVKDIVGKEGVRGLFRGLTSSARCSRF
jgi:hypothetical protein